MLCQECKKRPTCTSLCPDAEAYVNQDYVPEVELLIDAQRVDKVANESWAQRITSNVILTRKQRQIVRLIGLGLDRKDICKVLEITPNALDVAIHRLRKKAHEM